MKERFSEIQKNILSILKFSKKPVSAPEILNKLLKKNLNPNKTTVYRILDKLIKKNTISEISIKNKANHYEIKHNNHHQHHFICNLCEEIFCLKSCHQESAPLSLQELLPNPEFKIISHDISIYGICKPCSVK